MDPSVDCVIDRYQDLWILDSFCMSLWPGTRNWTETHGQSRNTDALVKREKSFESRVGQSWGQRKGSVAPVPSELSDFVGLGWWALSIAHALPVRSQPPSWKECSSLFHQVQQATLDLILYPFPLTQLDAAIYWCLSFAFLLDSWPCFSPLCGLSPCSLWSFFLVVDSLAVQDLLNFMCPFLLFLEIVSCIIRV